MHTCFLRTCLAPMRRYRAATCALMIGVALPFASVQAAPNLPNPVMFVTQVPVPADFATIGSVFANHMAGMQDAARGGDLWIRYANGNLRNLTAEAGYGMNGQQGANAIAVRDPAIHFNGSKAIFSMVIGAPTQQYQQITRYWQLYEITGFGVGQTISITHVPGQPEDTNNVESTYASSSRAACACSTKSTRCKALASPSAHASAPGTRPCCWYAPWRCKQVSWATSRRCLPQQF